MIGTGLPTDILFWPSRDEGVRRVPGAHGIADYLLGLGPKVGVEHDTAEALDMFGADLSRTPSLVRCNMHEPAEAHSDRPIVDACKQ